MNFFKTRAFLVNRWDKILQPFKGDACQRRIIKGDVRHPLCYLTWYGLGKDTGSKTSSF